jgi:hypothetical protein
MNETASFKRLILRAVLRQVSLGLEEAEHCGPKAWEID